MVCGLIFGLFGCGILVFCHMLNMVPCRRDVYVNVKLHSESLKSPQEKSETFFDLLLK